MRFYCACFRSRRNEGATFDLHKTLKYIFHLLKVNLILREEMIGDDSHDLIVLESRRVRRGVSSLYCDSSHLKEEWNEIIKKDSGESLVGQ
jgi:hypothetical protein